MMSSSIIVGYNLSAIGNHAYFFADAPDSIFCDNCGCCIDDTYLPENFKSSNKADIGATYDRRFIVSTRFKDYINGLDFNVNFLPVNPKETLFLMKPLEIIRFSAHQMENYCDKCHQYSDQVAPKPDFYYESGNILNNGIFFTSTSFGCGRSASPSIILGIETAKVISDAVKAYKFRGVDISKITVKVN
ncbi:hypothetical protein [Erwinia sorbitola]|uniref:Uncharacterized protein n=1 Tax=Erwinia sorbitola TaxID=2681984 RepID=A0A6I6EE29_9GAMM|nr:hypothetical protein [Erwinia sorbitola]QGU88104.1 hypothetical protein GN242_13110 [Erwinia sorbitola]